MKKEECLHAKGEKISCCAQKAAEREKKQLALPLVRVANADAGSEECKHRTEERITVDRPKNRAEPAELKENKVKSPVHAASLGGPRRSHTRSTQASLRERWQTTLGYRSLISLRYGEAR